MLRNAIRSKGSFLCKCTLFFTIILFLTLVFYNSLDSVASRFSYYFTWYNDCLSELLFSVGFTIDEVIVTGNKFTNKEDIMGLIDKMQPIICVSLSKLTDSIESLNKWIKHVRIYRTLPSTLHINIDEHETLVIDSEDELSGR